MITEKDILAALKPFYDTKRAEHDESYINTQYELLGCNMPAIRKVASMFDSASRKKLEAIWKTSKNFGVLYVVLVILNDKELSIKDWQMLKRLSSKIDNWAHSDMLSSIMVQLVELDPAKTYPDLKAWNNSKKPWQRRLSLTNLFYYSQMRSSYLPVSKVLPLVEALLQDDDVYVQKAVGWTLRETGNVYTKDAEAFIKKHVLDISSTAWSAATEKWPKSKKEPLKLKRKNARKRS